MGIIPDDEYVPHNPCGNTAEHSDHYWRADGKRCRYLDDPTVNYCYGVGEDT